MYRPVGRLGTLSCTAGFKEVMSVIERVAFLVQVNERLPRTSTLVEPDSAYTGFAAGLFSYVKKISGVVNLSQVPDSIVARVCVYMVNKFWWLNAIEQEPCNPVSRICRFVERDVAIPFAVPSSPLAYNPDGRKSYVATPVDIAAVGAVSKIPADNLWDNFNSHIKPFFDVVRGSVAPTTDTPILSQV